MRIQVGRARFTLISSLTAIAAFGIVAHGQQSQYPKQTQLPNPYQLVENWPTLPKSMNGGKWGELIRADIDPQGNIWVFHRCFNTEPAGFATCVGRAELGKSAKDSNGVVRGHQVFKLSPTGDILMTLGKEGVPGNGPDTFDQPTGIAIGSNGDIFVTDGHGKNDRVVKFSKDGKFIKTWGHHGSGPGEFDQPHDISIGGSQGHVFVADRSNSRVQIFDLDGNFIAAWKQFGRPSAVYVSKDDTLYVSDSQSNSTVNPGYTRGITVGSAKDGSLRAFIPDPDLAQADVSRISGASGIEKGAAR